MQFVWSFSLGFSLLSPLLPYSIRPSISSSFEILLPSYLEAQSCWNYLSPDCPLHYCFIVPYSLSWVGHCHFSPLAPRFAWSALPQLQQGLESTLPFGLKNWDPLERQKTFAAIEHRFQVCLSHRRCQTDDAWNHQYVVRPTEPTSSMSASKTEEGFWWRKLQWGVSLKSSNDKVKMTIDNKVIRASFGFFKCFCVYLSFICLIPFIEVGPCNILSLCH